MQKNPRLRFTDAERETPALKKPIRKAQKRALQANRAQAKVPKKTVKTKRHEIDPATGQIKKKLYFEEVDKKKPSSKLSHAVRDAPANTVLAGVHKEVQKSEDDNVGVESAHKLEETAETGGRVIQSAHRSHQLKPYRQAEAAERRLEKANVNFLHKKAAAENPQLSSNPVSRWQQKQAIKKEYAAAKRAGKSVSEVKHTAQNTAKTAKKAAQESKRAASFVWRHKKGFAIVLGIGLILAFFLNGLSSCSVLVEGGVSGIGLSSYQSEDADLRGAEAAYCAL